MTTKKEPTVISSRIILEGIEDDDADEMRGSLSEFDTMRRACTVSLSFKNLLKIENLEMLKNLTTLRLDNNMITRIEGLSHLKQLTWLDLSFNRIRKIEGLETLSNLTDLTLYNNEIRMIGALEGLSQLQCLSLGNNQIEQVEQILYLKRLPKLEVLVMDGNPMARSRPQQYRSFSLAFLPQLKYLDYALVLAADVAAAKETGVTPDLLAAVEDKEAQRRKQRDTADARARVLAEVGAANIDAVETLWADLFAHDAEYARLRAMPKMPDALDDFKKNFDAATAEFRENGLEKSARIEEEVAGFQAALGEAVRANDEALSDAIGVWEQRFQRLARTLAVAIDIANGGGGSSALATSAGFASGRRGGGGPIPHASLPGSAELEHLALTARGVGEGAVRDELRLHAAAEEMMNTFEGVMLEALAAKLSLHESYFRNVETMEGAWHAAVTALGEQLLAGLRDGTVKVEDDELLTLAADKDSLAGAITTSHEGHVAKIYRKEAEMRANEEQRCKGAVAKARDAAFARNRERLAEVEQWLRSVGERVAALKAELESAESEGGGSACERARGRDSMGSRGSASSAGGSTAGGSRGHSASSSRISAGGNRPQPASASSLRVPPLPLKA